MSVEDLRTSEEWQKLCKIEVLDPDGWDRQGDFNFSWYEEKISRETFMERVLPSTCKFNRADIKNPWKDITP